MYVTTNRGEKMNKGQDLLFPVTGENLVFEKIFVELV